MKVYQIILNEAGVEPIAGRPGSYRVVYPPEYKLPPEGPLSKYEAEKKLQDAELKFRNQKAQDYLDKKEAEKEAEKQKKEKSKKPEKSSTRKSRTPLPMPEDAGIKRTPQPRGLLGMRDRWRNRKENYAAYVEKYIPAHVAMLSWWTKWALRSLSLMAPVYKLYTELAQLEKDYIDEVEPFNSYETYMKRGQEISEEQADEVDMIEYNKARNFIVGEFMVLEGAIIITQVLRWVIRLVVWTSIFKNIFLWIGAPLTFYTSAVAAVGSEVLILIFIKWLESPEGRKHWEERFRTEIIGLGQVVDTSTFQAFNLFYNMYNEGKIEFSKEEVNNARKKLRDQGGRNPTVTDKAVADQSSSTEKSKDKTTDNQQNKKTGQGTQNDDRPIPSKKLPKLPPAEQTKTKYPDFIRVWSNGGWYVGGHPVTDGDGFLEPGADQVSTVDGARRWAISRGYPDPLADLPVRQGQNRPAPITP